MHVKHFERIVNTYPWEKPINQLGYSGSILFLLSLTLSFQPGHCFSKLFRSVPFFLAPSVRLCHSCSIVTWIYHSLHSNIEVHSLCCWFANCPLYTEGRKRLKEEASPFRLVGSSFIKQGNFWGGLSLVARSSLHLLARILKFIEALTGLGHVCHPAGHHNTLFSQSYALGIAPTVGMVDKLYIWGGGKEPLIAGVQLEGQFAVKSSQWPPTLHPAWPALKSYISLFPTCALSGQQGFSPV